MTTMMMIKRQHDASLCKSVK